MTIDKKIENDTLYVTVEGRLNTMTANEFEQALEPLDDVNNLIIDMKNLEYVSSAGLRIFLKAQKTISKKGSMVLKNVCDSVMEVFEMTGFTDILTIE